MIDAPIMERPILDSARSPTFPLEDINLQFQAPMAEDIALNELYAKWEGTSLVQETDTGKRLPKVRGAPIGFFVITLANR
jgi:hypothetical protein